MSEYGKKLKNVCYNAIVMLEEVMDGEDIKKEIACDDDMYKDIMGYDEDNELEKFIDFLDENILKRIGWNVSYDFLYSKDPYVNFNRYTSGGKDIELEIYTDDIEVLMNTVYEYAHDFDISEETILYLDLHGHGINGAPEDMRDVYNDIEEEKQLIDELYNTLLIVKETYEEFKF